jgi:hypothetical protein
MTTTNKGLTDPANGSLNWDTPLNANFDIIDKAFGGTVTKTVTGLGGTQTLAEADYQNLNIIFSGVLSSNLIYQVPSGVGGQWLLINATSGAYTLTFRTAAAGTTVTVPQGKNLVPKSKQRLVVWTPSACPNTIGMARMSPTTTLMCRQTSFP